MGLEGSFELGGLTEWNSMLLPADGNFFELYTMQIPTPSFFGNSLVIE